jgi:PTS system N-acetylgalactosamine-specific IIA component
MLGEHVPLFLYTIAIKQSTAEKIQEGRQKMKYILLVSHGTMAQGVHSVLDMLVGEGREDILSTSLKNGMGADELAENVRKCVSVVKEEDELLVFADLIGGSPLTTTANVLAEEGLLNRTTMVGGMNLPLVVSAIVSKDSVDGKTLVDMLVPEAREALREFTVAVSEGEDEI